jgi:hypothetical protein
MATVLESLRKSSINIENISKSLTETKKSTSAVNDSVENISRIIGTNTRVKRELFTRSNVLSSRREEASKRQELEDQIESTKVSTSPQAGLSFASRSEKGPLDRLLGFLGFMTAGWILENLPTWIFMGQEFISRINSFGRSMYNMVNNMQFIIKSFGQTLGYSLDAILRLDFEEFAGEGTVAKSFEELNLAVQDLGTNITDTFKLFTTPLTESLETGEQAPGLDEKQPDTMFPSTGQGGGIESISKFIAKAESGGRYTAYAGDRGRGDQAITTMTLTQLRQKYGDYNTAVGAYQFMPGTAIGLAKQLGMDPNKTVFTPEVQDKLNQYHLKTMGYEQFKSGKLPQREFGTRIAQQYRALPDPRTGRTYADQYAKGNAATVSLTEFNTVLTGSKNQTQIPQAPPPPPSSVKGGKIIEYLTGDRTHKRYRADHAAGNYHDHVAFDSKQTRDAAIKWLRGKGWVVGSINTGKHAEGSYHYSNQAFDIPFYPNQSKKGVTDDAKGETILSSRLRTDLISGGFTGPQLGGSSTKPQMPAPAAQISAQPKSSQPAAITPERKGSQMVFIDDTKPQVPQVSYPSQQQSSVIPTISEFKLLNNFIKKKLLLDLAYL